MAAFPDDKKLPLDDEPPQYEETTAGSSSATFDSTGFIATSQLQVNAIGYDTNQALTGKMLENITVYRVESGEPEYLSVRRKASSNSCALVRASDPSQNTLISTIYRWGPGRHPKMHLLPYDSAVSVEQAIENDNIPGEVVEAKSRKWYSRDQLFQTSLGEFTWTYGDRDEKKELNADSLLVMTRADGSKNGTQIAQLIRNDEMRTPGSKRHAGGNGGRLQIDLRAWQGEKTAGPGIEAFVVASCILMLKREADRFINNNIAAVS